MDDPPVGMTAFTGEMQGVAFGIEVHSPLGELGDGCRRCTDRRSNHFGVTQARTGVQGIFNMRFKAVLRVCHCGYAALSPVG